MQSTPNSLDLSQSPTFRPSAVTVAQSPLTLSSSREESRSTPFQKRPIEGYNGHISRSDTNATAMGPVGAADIHPSHAADNQSDRPTDRTRFHGQDMDQRSKQGGFVRQQQQQQSNDRYPTTHDQRQKDHSMDVEDSLGDENERDEDSEENVDELMEEDGDFEEEGSYRQGMDPYHSNNSNNTNRLPSAPSRPGNSPHPESNGNHKDVARHQFNGENISNGSGGLQPQTRWEYRSLGSEPYGRLKQEEEDPMDNSGDGNGSDEDEGQEGEGEGEGEGEEEPRSATNSGVNNGSSKKRTTPARHKCPQCDKYFTRPFNLKSHQRTHTQERPFVCSFTHCARAFSRLHDCNRHMRTHWRIKPYSCPECHRNFVRQDALTRHLRLDFGHNRCSGYPGPSSGSSAAHGNDARTPSPEDESGHSNDGKADPSNGGPSMQDKSHGESKHPSSAFTRSPSPTSPMVVSPTTQKPKDSKSSMMMPRTAPNLGPAPMGIHGRIPPRETAAPYPPRESESHPRYPGTSSAPMSFVHRSNTADRRAITPPGAIKDEVNYHGQHARSYSHSSYPQSQPPSAGPHSPTLTFPPRSGSGPMVIGGPGGSDKRAIAPAVPRHAASWSHQGHQGHELPELPPGEYPSHGSPHSRQTVDGGPLAAGRYPEGSYAPDQHRPPSRPRLMHSQSDYPAHGQDAKRPSPTSPRSEWGPQRAGPDDFGPWGPEHQQRPQDARMRRPSWSSPSTARGPPSASYPPDHATPSSMPPPRTMTLDAWHRNGGGAPYPPHENRGEQANPREMVGSEGPNRAMTRPLSSYGGPPPQYPNDPNGREALPPSGFPSGHPPPPNSDPMPRANPSGRRSEAEREPMRRSTTEYDRSRPPLSWSVGSNGGGDQRSRSFQQDPVEPRGASRHESYGREKGFVPRPFDGPGPPPSNGGPAASGAAPPNERVHPYGAGGMVGVERMPSRTNSYHEREPSREGMSGKEGGDPREYMPTRSYSSVDYETEKRSQERQARYGGGAPLPPKVMTRDLHRRSMSPASQRTPTTAEMSPRYHYSAGSGHGPTDSFGRDEMSSSSFRSVRPPPPHHEPASPRGREEFGRDQGGYFGEAGSRSGPPTPYGSTPYSYPPGSTAYPQQQRGVPAMYSRRQTDGPPPPPPQQQHHHDSSGMRRDRGSIDMAMVAPLSISTPPGSGGPPMSAKRPPLPLLHNQQVKLEN